MEAVEYAFLVIKESRGSHSKQPGDYATTRWFIATAFATGSFPDVPWHARRHIAWEDRHSWNNLQFKALCRHCRGLIGLCHGILRHRAERCLRQPSRRLSSTYATPSLVIKLLLRKTGVIQPVDISIGSQTTTRQRAAVSSRQLRSRQSLTSLRSPSTSASRSTSRQASVRQANFDRS